MTGPGIPLGDASRRGTPWLITFVDLVGILLAFFVLQFAMSRFDETRWDGLFGAAADTVPMGADRADRDASLTAAMLSPDPDAGYLAALLRERIAAAGMVGVSVALAGDAVILGFDRMPAGGLVALEPVLRRLPISLAVRVAVADASSETLWQAAFAEATAIAGTLQRAGAAPKVESFAVAGSDRSRITLILGGLGEEKS